MLILTRNLDAIAQIGIALLGIIALWLVSRKNKWGFVFGLAAQPFWLITSILNKQWGILILTIVYSITWTYGIYKWFFHPER